MACCPFHAEKTPSFTVSPNKQFYHCFWLRRAQYGHRLPDGLRRLEFLDAVEELARHAGLGLPQTGDGGDSSRTLRERVVKLTWRFFRQQLRTHPARQRAVDYLRRRGLTGQIAAAFRDRLRAAWVGKSVSRAAQNRRAGRRSADRRTDQP